MRTVIQNVADPKSPSSPIVRSLRPSGEVLVRVARPASIRSMAPFAPAIIHCSANRPSPSAGIFPAPSKRSARTSTVPHGRRRRVRHAALSRQAAAYAEHLSRRPPNRPEAAKLRPPSGGSVPGRRDGMARPCPPWRPEAWPARADPWRAGALGISPCRSPRRRAPRSSPRRAPAKLDFVRWLGADKVIDYARTICTEVRDLDLALETVGGDHAEQSLTILKNGGVLMFSFSTSTTPPGPRLRRETSASSACPSCLTAKGLVGELGKLVDAGRHDGHALDADVSRRWPWPWWCRGG